MKINKSLPEQPIDQHAEEQHKIPRCFHKTPPLPFHSLEVDELSHKTFSFTK